MTVAARGSRESSAISPKKSPSSSRTLPVPESTSTLPLAIRYMALPRSPLWMMVAPAGTVRARSMATRSAIGGGVQVRKQRHARHHGEGDDEVAAADLLVEAAADDGDGQREAADAQHDRDGGDDAAERGDRRDLAAADLGQHRGGPPDGLRHVAELVGLEVALDRIHGGSGCEQNAREDDDAGEQRAPLGGDQAAERCQRRRVARELQEAHQPRQCQQCHVWEQQLQQQRQQGQRVDQHQRRRCKAQAGAGRRERPQQRVLGRGPDARHVLDGEHQHAQPVEDLQAGAVVRRDVRNGLRYGSHDVADHEQDQHPVDDARGKLPAPPVLQDLEGALAQARPGLRLCVHRMSRPQLLPPDRPQQLLVEGRHRRSLSRPPLTNGCRVGLNLSRTALARAACRVVVEG